MARKSPAPTPRPETALAVAGASWLALVAATTVGAPVNQLRALVRAEGVEASAGAPLRLVVQTYAPQAVQGGRPLEQARALGSTQRAITPAELAAGVAVSIPQLATVGGSVVVAWVEAGAPDLEFDALRARPAADAMVGTASPSAQVASLVLRHGVG